MEHKFYKHSEEVHNSKAPKEVVPIVMDIVQPKSVLDVGCGLGTWLHAFDELGLCDYLGVDGEYVDKNHLKIGEDRFISQDLRKPWSLSRKFDVVISLEVAEHLEESYAEHFVKTLVEHGDVIIFSAAIPGQGGQYHVNEQWLSYWVRLFAKQQFNYHDVLRSRIWNNHNVDVWYKQNMVLFCKAGHPLNQELSGISSEYVDLVHPDLFQFYLKRLERVEHFEEGKLGIRISFGAFLKALVNKIR